MHLKSCCALLLLALAACQAAPSIEKRSIAEEASEIEQTNLGMEDPGADKERTKKSTTFCVEVHGSNQQQVPCPEKRTEHLQLVESRPVQLVQSAPAAHTVLIQQPSTPVKLETLSSPSPIHTVHLQPQPALQTLHLQPAPQPIQTVHVQPAPQPIQTVHVQPALPAPQPVQYVVPQPHPHPQPNIVIPPAPAAQQPPIVNILTPPAAPCNVVQPPPPVHEIKHEPAKIERVEVPHKPHKPQPTEFDIVSVEAEPPCDDVYLVPAKPAVMIPERLTLQKAQMGYYRPPQAVIAEAASPCLCSQRKASQVLTWPRTHHKIHEHHVTVHPSLSSLSSPMLVQPYPVSYLGQNTAPLTSNSLERPSNTIVSVYQQNDGSSYFTNRGYPLTPIYLSSPTSSDNSSPQIMQTANINSYPKVYYRNAQSIPTSDNIMQYALTAPETPDTSKGETKIGGNQKREADINQPETYVENSPLESGTFTQGVTSQINDATNTK